MTLKKLSMLHQHNLCILVPYIGLITEVKLLCGVGAEGGKWSLYSSYLYTKENLRMWTQVHLSLFDEFVILSKLVLVIQSMLIEHIINFM